MLDLPIHHYGLATHDLEKSAAIFQSLGYKISGIFVDPIQKVQLVFASRAGEPLIEIIADTDDFGPTKNILTKAGCSFYHICYETSNMEKSIQELAQIGFLIKHKPVEAVAFQNRKIAWAYHRQAGLVELLEKE